MAPVHRAPHVRVWVLLVKEVPLAFEKDEAVGVIHPVFGRGKMELGAVGFAVHDRWRRGLGGRFLPGFVAAGGEKGWAPKAAFWGVGPDEVLD